MKHNTLKNLDFLDADIKSWSVKNVLKFLQNMQLNQYQSNFYNNKIKGKDLISLSEKEFKEDLRMQ